MGLCIGSEFGVGARGELLLAGRREQAWPFPLCDLAEANGVRVDPERGLWAPERAVTVVEGGEYLGTDVTLGTTAYTPNPPAPIEIENASRCQSLLVWGSVRIDWGIDVDPATVVSVRCGHRMGVPVESFASYSTQAAPDGVPKWTWHSQWVEPFTAVIPPETVGKLYVNARFQLTRGAGVLTYMSTRVAGAAITI